MYDCYGKRKTRQNCSNLSDVEKNFSSFFFPPMPAYMDSDEQVVLEEKIEEFKKKYPDENNVPRPPYWSGWALTPYKIEFWKDVKNRLHQRLCYSRIGDTWSKEILYP